MRQKPAVGRARTGQQPPRQPAARFLILPHDRSRVSGAHRGWRPGLNDATASFQFSDFVPALLLFALWTLLASVHLLRRTWHSPAPVAQTHATIGT